MDMEKSEVDPSVKESVKNSEEFRVLTDTLESNYGEFELEDLRSYKSEDQSVDDMLVYPILDLNDDNFTSLAFGVKDGEVRKANVTVQFDDRVREYRFVHEDEDFYEPEENLITEDYMESDGQVDVIEYKTQD